MANGLTIAFGPYGLYEPPRQWDEGTYSTVRELSINSGEVIYSLQIVYDIEGKSISGKKHGEGDGTGTQDTVKLNYPTEYLISILGYIGIWVSKQGIQYLVVKSLTIESNMKKYGPYGKEEGTYFRTPLGAGKIVGFFGRYGTCLDSIGVYIKPFHEIDSTTPLGPFGGAGGQQWDDETYNTVRELTIYSGYDIDSIQVVYDDIEGKPVSGKKHGGDSGQPNMVKLDYPIEYLLSISGHYGYNDNNTLVLRSLTLQSNIKQYGPYGTENGTHFITPLAAGKIVGFFGRDGARLDSIGVYIKPFQISVGPFGTTRGQQWDDGIYDMVRELTIYSEEGIQSIQVVYNHAIQGNPILGTKHGGNNGTTNTVKLDLDEFLLSVWGYYGQVGNMVVIRSLGFQSNKKTYGPFGVEDGEKFQFPSIGGKIIGFYGRSHDYLTSIGAHVAPFPNLVPSLASENKI